MAFMFITMGLFASAITDNQIVSAIVAFIIILITQLLTVIAGYTGSAASSIAKMLGVSANKAYNFGSVINKAIAWFDPFVKTQDFRIGIFSVSALIFLVSIGVLFMYLTFRVLEKKRWSQS